MDQATDKKEVRVIHPAALKYDMETVRNWTAENGTKQARVQVTDADGNTEVLRFGEKVDGGLFIGTIPVDAPEGTPIDWADVNAIDDADLAQMLAITKHSKAHDAAKRLFGERKLKA